MQEPAVNTRQFVICSFCGKPIVNNESFYVTYITYVREVIKKKLSRERMPIFKVCCDCVRNRFIEESLRYNFSIPDLITIDELTGSLGLHRDPNK